MTQINDLWYRSQLVLVSAERGAAVHPMSCTSRILFLLCVDCGACVMSILYLILKFIFQFEYFVARWSWALWSSVIAGRRTEMWKATVTCTIPLTTRLLSLMSGLGSLLQNGVQICRSLPREALRSLVICTQVSRVRRYGRFLPTVVPNAPHSPLPFPSFSHSRTPRLPSTRRR
jgi:hypothetical protein